MENNNKIGTLDLNKIHKDKKARMMEIPEWFDAIAYVDEMPKPYKN